MKPPGWIREVVRKWEAGVAHVFLLYGNTNDVVAPGMPVKDFLVATDWLAKREAVILYDRSRGISFPLPGHRERFMKMAGLRQEQEQNPALAALQRARGQTPAEQASLPAAPGAAFPFIEKALLEKGERGPAAALIVDHAETVFPAADVAVMNPEDRTVLVTVLRWAQEKEFVALGPPVFLLAENATEVNPLLRRASSRIENVRVPYPDFETRLEFLEALSRADGKRPALQGCDLRRIAALTAGLKLVHIEDIVLRADLEDRPVDDELVRERKEELIRSEFQDVLQIIEPQIGFDDIGGMYHVKEFFLRSVVRPMRAGDAARVPMGVLLLGPPGTGKSALAEAVARESGMNCCSLNVGRLLGSYVGQSEKNLARALECIEALAPTIVFIDEIDQAGLSRTGDNTGVTNRIFQQLLQFMSDARHRGRIVFLAASNRPDLIDPALKRPGRFDKKVPILAPEAAEREAIFRTFFRRYGIPAESDLNLSPAVAATEGWTGAEMEALVLKAWELAGDRPLSARDLAEALKRYVPLTQGVEEMAALAVAECNDLDLLPPSMRERVLAERSGRNTTEREPVRRGRRA